MRVEPRASHHYGSGLVLGAILNTPDAALAISNLATAGGPNDTVHCQANDTLGAAHLIFTTLGLVATCFTAKDHSCGFASSNELVGVAGATAGEGLKFAGLTATQGGSPALGCALTLAGAGLQILAFGSWCAD